MAESRPASLVKRRRELVQAKDAREHLSTLKASLPVLDIAPFLRSLATYPYFLPIYAPGAKPPTYAHLRRAPMLEVQSLQRELAWTASILKNFEQTLTEFTKAERAFAHAWLSGDFEGAALILTDVDKRFGKSAWLIEKRLALLQESSGLDAQKNYSYRIRDDESATAWSYYFAYNFSMRMEPSVSSTSYAHMVETQTLQKKSESFDAYLTTYLLPTVPMASQWFAHILCWDETAPVVDQYLTFLRVAQQICVEGAGRKHSPERGHLETALASSGLAIDDYRLTNIRYLLGLTPPSANSSPPSAVGLFDDYTIGRYESAMNRAQMFIGAESWRADIYEILVKSSLKVGSRSREWSPNSPLGRLLTAYEAVIVKSENYVDAVEQLKKFALVANDPILSNHIFHLLDRERLRDELTSLTEIAANLSAPVGNPWQLTTFNVVASSRDSGDKLFHPNETSPSIRLQQALCSNIRPYQAILDLPIFSELPAYRRDFYTARILERNNCLAEASELYQRWLGSDYRPLYFDSVLRLTWARFLTKSYDEVLQLIARTYLRSPFTHASLPVGEVLAAIQSLDPFEHAKSPALSIVHDIYFKHISQGYDGERSDAFEDYLTHAGLTRPSQLKDVFHATQDGTDRTLLLYYLRYICVPRIMDHSTEYQGTTDLLSERIAICQLLSEIDQSNADSFSDEIRSITQELVVSEGVRHIEQSRIYVDTDNIRSNVEKPLSEGYVRYMQLPSSDAPGATRRFVLQEIGVVSETSRSVLYVPIDERRALLISMIDQFGAQFFMNPRHGLTAYLSGRIRHGILPNHLRSPLQLAQLATVQDSRTGTYHPNEYWMNRLADLPLATRQNVGARLAAFTAEIDKLIDMVNQRWIQLRRSNTPDGLFDFTYSPQDLFSLEAKIATTQGYEEFIDALFESSWRFTEVSLSRVRQRIDDDLKPRIVGAFDKLETDLAALLQGFTFSALDAAITKARTDMLGTLDTVKGWFRLSTAAEKPDFNLNTLVDIAIRSTNNCFKYSPLTPATSLNATMRLRGSTLTSLVELLFLFLSNIILRSNIKNRVPQVSFDVSNTPEGWLRFCIENDVVFDNEKDREAAERNIAEVKELMARNDPTALLDRHRGTGYARAQKLLTHDLKCKHIIEFGLIRSDRFRVTVALDPHNLQAAT